MRAILYAAKSTEDTHGSIATQLDDGRSLAAQDDLEVLAEYADEAQSAWKGDRGPELAAALEHAERLAPAALIVQHSDRLARGDARQARHLVEIALWAIKAGVTIRSVQDPSTFENLVMAVVMGERNSEDSRRKSLAVKAGHRRRSEKGLAHSGKRKFGFEMIDGHLRPVEAEVAIVGRILAELLAGRSAGAIARDLEAERVPTATGGKWHGATITEVARNPVYVGRLRRGEEVVEGEHEAVVDVDLWRKVQVLLDARAEASKGRGRPTVGRHLFRKGMLRCGMCGGSMVPRTTRPGKSRPGRSISETYNCYNRLRDTSSCSMTPVKRAEIDTAVYSYFEQVSLDVDATREQLSEARDQKLSEVRVLLEQGEAEKRRAEERLARVRRDYADGAITAEDWGDFREELTAELEGATAEVERLLDQRVDVEAWGDLQDAEHDTLERLADLRRAMAGEISDAEGVAAIRGALARLFEHFTIRKVGAGVRVHAELAWMGDYILEPEVREQAIEGWSPLRPVFRRERLYPSGATIEGSPSSSRARRRPMDFATRSIPRPRSRRRRT